MLKRYHLIVGGTFRIIDSVVIGLVWLASYWMRFTLPFIQVTKGFPGFEKYAALTPLVIFLWWVVFSTMRVYQPRRLLRRTDEALLLLKAHITALILFVALTYLFSEYRYSRGVILYFGATGAIILVALRLTLRNALRAIRRKGYNLRYVLIVGEGPAAEDLVKKFQKFPELGLKVMGMLAEESGPSTPVPVLGNYNDLERILRTHTVDQILIALPRKHSGRLDALLDRLKDETVELRLVPDIHDYITLGCEVEEFDGLPVVNLNDSPLDGWGSVLKRLTDIFLSLAALALLSPVMLLIAVLVRLSSRGPMLYAQQRMGLDGHVFKMYKFRSMKIDAEDATGAVWANAGDSRRTALGSFLRATSLDELPQFWNVLKGDMSLVGPRPERPVFVEKFRSEIPHYMLRHKVKAGITGWAQVNGWRGNTSLERRIEYDLYYIRHWSYLLDLQIITMTFWKGFINKNAY